MRKNAIKPSVFSKDGLSGFLEFLGLHPFLLTPLEPQKCFTPLEHANAIFLSSEPSLLEEGSKSAHYYQSLSFTTHPPRGP